MCDFCDHHICSQNWPHYGHLRQIFNFLNLTRGWFHKPPQSTCRIFFKPNLVQSSTTPPTLVHLSAVHHETLEGNSIEAQISLQTYRHFASWWSYIIYISGCHVQLEGRCRRSLSTLSSKTQRTTGKSMNMAPRKIREYDIFTVKLIKSACVASFISSSFIPNLHDVRGWYCSDLSCSHWSIIFVSCFNFFSSRVQTKGLIFHAAVLTYT